jgi:hypothetical protein
MSTDNPYEPSGLPPVGPGPDSGLAASKVSGPAIALIVVGVVYVLMALFGLANSTRMLMAGPGEVESQLTEEQRQQFEQLKSQGIDIMKIVQAGGGTMGLVFSILHAAVAGAIIVGAQKMKNLQSRGMAMTAAILAMIPCLTPSVCCILGLPMGIWALVTLNDPVVKSSFTG